MNPAAPETTICRPTPKVLHCNECYSHTDATFVAGNADLRRAVVRLALRILAQISGSGACHSRGKTGCELDDGIDRGADPSLRLGSVAARQSDSRSAVGRDCARLCLLGILRVCAGHAEPCCDGIRYHFDSAT